MSYMSVIESQSIAAALLQSQARTALLQQLLVQGTTASVSALARRVGLSPRAVGQEVKHLSQLGLVDVERIGTADVVRARPRHPAVRPLRVLLSLPAGADVGDVDEATDVRRSMAAWGAPLVVSRPTRAFDLHTTIVAALEHARTDGTVLRVLPTLVLRNRPAIDWIELAEKARARRVRAELGLVLDVAAAISGDDTLVKQADALIDRRVRQFRYFPAVSGRFEAELAQARSPDVATRWRFWMNLSLESFRSTWERHRA